MRTVEFPIDGCRLVFIKDGAFYGVEITPSDPEKVRGEVSDFMRTVVESTGVDLRPVK